MNESEVEWLIACGSILSRRNTLKRYSVNVGYAGGGCEKSQSARVWINVTLVFSLAKNTVSAKHDLLSGRFLHCSWQGRQMQLGTTVVQHKPSQTNTEMCTKDKTTVQSTAQMPIYIPIHIINIGDQHIVIFPGSATSISSGRGRSDRLQF